MGRLTRLGDRHVLDFYFEVGSMLYHDPCYASKWKGASLVHVVRDRGVEQQ